jgi:hypothetical protein
LTQYDWRAVGSDTARKFGNQFPNQNDEQVIVDAFERRPTAVLSAIERLVQAYQAGRVHSPWFLLKRECETILASGQMGRDLADDSMERETAIGLVDAWLANAGLYYDRESEVLDEVFEVGRLRAWKDDQELRLYVIARWNAARPRGVRREREALRHAEEIIASKKRVASLLSSD